MLEDQPDFRQMTADTVGKDLLQALVTEIKLLPDPWQKIPKKKQDDIIDRLRSRVDHLVGMNDVQGEDDQRSMDLGHEYRDDDGGGMDGNVVDAEFDELPAPGDIDPTTDELNKAFDDGYTAAEEGKPESDCPIMHGKLCIEWVKGWKAFHEGEVRAAA